jgi:VanZ family protein
VTAARIVSGVLALVWMTTIFILSSHPMPDIDLGFSAQDKLVHLVGYGLLSALLLGAMPWREGGYRLRHVVLAALLATLYGLSDEWHQSFVPGRNSDVLDIIADAVGALLGSGLLWVITRRFVAKPA